VFAQLLEEPRLERDAELQRQTQVGVTGFECDDVSLEVRVCNAGSTEQLWKFAARLAAEGAEDLGDQFDGPFGRGRRRVEMP
jgi:hypothetical protein